jgi:hypothetical protein
VQLLAYVKGLGNQRGRWRDGCASPSSAWIRIRLRPPVSSRTIPSLLVFRSGREVDRIVVAHTKAEIIRRLERTLV